MVNKFQALNLILKDFVYNQWSLNQYFLECCILHYVCWICSTHRTHLSYVFLKILHQKLSVYKFLKIKLFINFNIYVLMYNVYFFAIFTYRVCLIYCEIHESIHLILLRLH